jgi:hypothetical protein
MRRVLRCDGVIPQWSTRDHRAGPDDVRAIRAWLAENGGRPELDVIAEGETPADDPAAAKETVRAWADAGATWWLEERWSAFDEGLEESRTVRERIAAGPPAP